MKRGRPRFTLRTLVIVVTIVCLYFGVWRLTIRYGIRDFIRRGNPELTESDMASIGYLDFSTNEGTITSPCPLVLSSQERGSVSAKLGSTIGCCSWHSDRRMYAIWIFGLVIDTPFRYRPTTHEIRLVTRQMREARDAAMRKELLEGMR
jgi:hypothetical protein